MKKNKNLLFIYIFTLLFPLCFMLEGVEVDWISRGGAYGLDKCHAVCKDADGYIYATGQYRPQASFIGGNGIYVSPTDERIFVAKFDPETGRVIWVKNAGGSMSNVGYGICVDPVGDIIVTGVCSGNTLFGDAFFLESTGSFNIFVAKLSSDGEWDWVKVIANSNSKSSNSVTTDGVGNIYITGYYYDELVVGDETLTSRGVSDGFIAKLNSNGQWQWGRSLGGSGEDKCYDVVADSAGNVYGTGYYAGTATIGSLGNITAVSSYDSFVFKINSSGQWQWVRSFGGSSLDYSYGIDLNNQNEPCVAGYFGGDATFGSLPVIQTTGFGYYDLFVASLNTIGEWQWAESSGAVDSFVQVYGFDIDHSNNYYITGGFSSTLQLPGLDAMVSNGYQDIFVAKLGSDFNWKWSFSAGNTGSESGAGVVADSKGCFAVGGFQKTDTFFGSKRLSNYGHVDYYVAKLLAEEVNPIDFNADSHSDLLWQNQDNNALLSWYLDGSGGRSEAAWFTNGAGHGRFVGSSDINGDGYVDLVFEEGNGENTHASIWFAEASGVYSPENSIDTNQSGGNWKLVGVSDLLEDGVGDLLWQEMSSGQVNVWKLNVSGEIIGNETLVGSMAEYRIVATGDLDGDAHQDVIWQRRVDGRVEVIAWFLDGALQRISSKPLAGFDGDEWSLIRLGDYNEDGNMDLLWQNDETGQVLSWLLNSNQERYDVLNIVGSQSAEWRLGHWSLWSENEVLLHDYNSDSNADLIWQNLSNNSILCWHYDGAGGKTTSSWLTNGSYNGRFAGSADINGDGFLDLVFQEGSDASTHASIWFAQSSEVYPANGRKNTNAAGDGWILVAVADLLEDGTKDLIWQESSTGRVVVWGLDANGNRTSVGTLVGAMADYRIMGAADFNDDGHEDVIWQRKTATHTQVVVWFLDGNLGRSSSANIVNMNDLDWNVTAVSDYNSDGNNDLIWQNAITGQVVAWTFDESNQRTGSIGMAGNQPIDWRVGHWIW